MTAGDSNARNVVSYIKIKIFHTMRQLYIENLLFHKKIVLVQLIRKNFSLVIFFIVFRVAKATHYLLSRQHLKPVSLYERKITA